MFILSFLCSFIISIIFSQYLKKKELDEKLELCNELFKPTFLRRGDKLIISRWNGIGIESNRKLYRCSIVGYAGKYGRIDFEIPYDDLSSEEIKLIIGKPGFIFNPSHGSIMFFEFFSNLDCHFIVDKETLGEDWKNYNREWRDVFSSFTPDRVIVNPIVKILVLKVIKSQLGILGGVYFLIEDISFSADKYYNGDLVMTVSVNFNRGDQSVSIKLAKILESYIAENLSIVREDWLRWNGSTCYVKPISVEVVNI